MNIYERNLNFLMKRKFIEKEHKKNKIKNKINYNIYFYK